MPQSNIVIKTLVLSYSSQNKKYFGNVKTLAEPQWVIKCRSGLYHPHHPPLPIIFFCYPLLQSLLSSQTSMTQAVLHHWLVHVTFFRVLWLEGTLSLFQHNSRPRGASYSYSYSYSSCTWNPQASIRVQMFSSWIPKQRRLLQGGVGWLSSKLRGK